MRISDWSSDVCSSDLRTGEGAVRALLLALVLLAGASPALAQSSLPPAAYANRPLLDAAQEEQAQALMHTLRCLVCQNQTIADSNAEMAGDMRALVRERTAPGGEPQTVRRGDRTRGGEGKR